VRIRALSRAEAVCFLDSIHVNVLALAGVVDLTVGFDGHCGELLLLPQPAIDQLTQAIEACAKSVRRGGVERDSGKRTAE
jgi:hypothetical protein